MPCAVLFPAPPLKHLQRATGNLRSSW